MGTSLNIVSQKINAIIEKKRNVTLVDLEQYVEASFNLIFLAIDSLVTKKKIIMRRTKGDYLISLVDQELKLKPNNYLCNYDYVKKGGESKCQDQQ